MLLLLTGCATAPQIAKSCPEFPFPSTHVVTVLDDVSSQDPLVANWVILLQKHAEKLDIYNGRQVPSR